MPGCFMPFAEPWCPNLPGWHACHLAEFSQPMRMSVIQCFSMNFHLDATRAC